MKIKTDEPSRLIIEQTKKRPNRTEATKFGEILQRTIEHTKPEVQEGAGLRAAAELRNVQTAKTEAAGSIGAMGSVEAIGTIDEQQGPILERVEQLLDTLDEYQQNLGSTSVPGESLQPIIGRMEEHNKALAAVLVTLPDSDNLKDILNRVLITSVVEVEKFKRGDYS